MILILRIKLMTDETVRCPSCRGAKKVPKLGGMIGECNTCAGVGKINVCDKVKIVSSEPDAISSNCIIDAVATAIPFTASEIVPVIETPSPDVKVDPKKALYKRKG
jgi:RecJ-like exonuclease